MGSIFLALLVVASPGTSGELVVGAPTQLVCEALVKGIVDDTPKSVPGGTAKIQRPCQPYTVLSAASGAEVMTPRRGN
jgi:hypothetical protein